MDSDEQLMLAAKEGDRASFARLVEKYHVRIVNFVHRYTGNVDVAEDLAQDVFVKLFESRRRYRPTARFSTFLFRIATNTALTALRSRRRHAAASVEHLQAKSGGHSDVLADTNAEEPLQQLARQERIEAIRRAVAKLPDSQRMAVLLHRFQGMSYAEVGTVMNLTYKAVKSLLFRAREKLREELEGKV